MFAVLGGVTPFPPSPFNPSVGQTINHGIQWLNVYAEQDHPRLAARACVPTVVESPNARLKPHHTPFMKEIKSA